MFEKKQRNKHILNGYPSRTIHNTKSIGPLRSDRSQTYICSMSVCLEEQNNLLKKMQASKAIQCLVKINMIG